MGTPAFHGVCHMKYAVCFLIAITTCCQIATAQIESATVMVAGCSGVCVDPAGLVLTVKHCDLPETVQVRFRDRLLSATRVYSSPETEGPVVYDCEGDGLPFVPVAATAPIVGERMTSFGFPERSGRRELRRQVGTVLRWSTLQFRGGEFTGNILSFPCASGWSGGPLLNSRGEVCGLLSSSDNQTSVFVSSAAIRTALTAVKSRSRDTRPELPELQVFGSTDCAPCRQFKNDLSSLPWFANRLDAMFRVVLIDVRKSPEIAARHDISAVPTFVTASGRRITGYSGPQSLLVSLGSLVSPDPKPPPAETRPPANPPSPPTKPDSSPPAQSASPALPKPSVPPAIQQAPETPPDSKPVGETPPPATGSPADTLDRIVQVTQKAVTIATWLGITGVSGGTAGAVLGGLALWRSLRSRQHRSSPTATIPPPTIVHDAEPLPQAIVPETRFAAYERDSHAEAFAWATAEIARKYPGSVGTLESLQGLINQYLASRGLKRPTNP